MNQIRSFHCEPQQLPDLVTATKEWLCSEGFTCQQLATEQGGVLLQIEKTEGWRKAIGMSTALNIVFTSVEKTVNIEIGAGRWIDKAAAGAVSFFILWPLAITSGIGAWQQMKLPERVYEHVAVILQEQMQKTEMLSTLQWCTELIAKAKAMPLAVRDKAALEKAIAECDSILKKEIGNTADSISTYCQRVTALWLLGNLPQAKEDIVSLLRKNEEGKLAVEKQRLVELNQLAAQISSELGKYDEAMVFIARSNTICSDETRRENFNLLRQMRAQRLPTLGKEPLCNRQVILCTDDIPFWKTEKFCFSDIEGLQSTGWKFQVGHPQRNMLYICHPLRCDVYHALDEFHDRIFEDKQGELIHLLESLGASSIYVEAISDIVGQESFQERMEGEVSGDTMTVGITGHGVATSAADAQHRARQSGVWNLELKANIIPKIPNDLVWYYHEPTWQRIAESALTDAYRKVTVELRYQDDFSINATRLKEIEGELRHFPGGLQIRWDTETERRLQYKKNTVWKFTAEFPESAERGAALSYDELVAGNFSPEEAEYAEELRDCLADGVITDDARRLLERHKAKLQIPDARAQEIERLVGLVLRESERGRL